MVKSRKITLALRAIAVVFMLMFLAAPQLISTASKASEDCPFFYGIEYRTWYFSGYPHTDFVGFCEGNNCTGWESCTGEKTPYYETVESTVLCNCN